VPAAPATAASPARGLPAELERGLGEIESYVAMGFVDDAKGVLQDLVARFGTLPALVERVGAVGLEMPGSQPSAPAGLPPEPDLGLDEALVEIPVPEAPPARRARPTPEPPRPAPSARREPAPAAADEPISLGEDLFADLTSAAPAGMHAPASAPDELSVPEPPGAAADARGGFDLASELGDLFSAKPAVTDEPPAASGTDFGDAALADIFREFQKGVDKQLGKEDYETRYNLGIAYKEMGLVDEAIAEFQLAAKDDGRLLECASMLGICFLEKGMPKLAVKWFEKGLSAPGRSEDEYQALRYDLANALEQSGEPGRALAVFTELFGQDANFRDVADRVRQLGASR
jgi:hypothetical protein